MRLAILAGVIALGAPLPAAAQRIVRGPYLQRGAPTEMTVVWRTDEPTAGVVHFGPSPGSQEGTVRVDEAATQHEVRLTGLAPATRYYYSVGDGAGLSTDTDDPTFFFETSPEAGSVTRFRAWIVGDSGTGDGRQAAARNGMYKVAGRDPPELFLHLGDMAYTDGKEVEFQTRFFEPYFLTLRNTVTWPTLGNHEGNSSDSASESGPYFDAYVLPRAAEAGGLPTGTEAYYSFDHANVHFVVLDSHHSSRAVDGAMLTWLREDLAATSRTWIVAYWHHPPYSKGSHDSDTESQLIEMRENALPILEEAGVDLVLAGHSHIYERSYLVAGAYETPTTADGKILDGRDGKLGGEGAYVKGPASLARDGAVYVVAGHGGASISQDGMHPLMYFAETELGSCLLDVEGNHLTLRNLRHDGEITDTFTLVKGEAFLVTAPDGGERLAAGSTTPLTWSTVGSAATVDLHYSLDDGRTWQPLATGVANDGSHDWTLPDASSETLRVRVSDPAGRVAADGSDGSATLYQGSDPGPGNHPPVVLPVGELQVVQDTLVVLQIRSIDPDGDPVRYAVEPLPDGATLDAPSGLFTWVPDADQSGRWWLEFSAEDDQGARGTGVGAVIVQDGAGGIGDAGNWPEDGDSDAGAPSPPPKTCKCTQMVEPGPGALTLLGLLLLAWTRQRGARA
ncbi:MAG: metallophosphoesterase [Deltaproteobacteria bacterium]|nr:metallophosphoesterase [Deltaproteobacteria bacterium]